jgi:hypothetical protein
MGTRTVQTSPCRYLPGDMGFLSVLYPSLSMSYGDANPGGRSHDRIVNLVGTCDRWFYCQRGTRLRLAGIDSHWINAYCRCHPFATVEHAAVSAATILPAGAHNARGLPPMGMISLVAADSLKDGCNGNCMGGKTMLKTVTVAVLFLLMAFLPLTGYAAGNDNAVALPAGEQSSSSGNPSYFEGDWVGRWPGFKSSSIYQDAAINIRKGKKEGVFLVEYSWEGGPSGSGFPTFPGSVKAKGREEGDKFVFGWTNKQGKEMTITLKKYEESKIMARLEKSGPTGNNERPFNEAIFQRK